MAELGPKVERIVRRISVFFPVTRETGKLGVGASSIWADRIIGDLPGSEALV
jgi:hypothetical protein